MWTLAKFFLGIFIFILFFCFGNAKGCKKYDNIMLFLIFALFGIRTFFCVTPDYAGAIRYLQGSWYMYIYDWPLIYFLGRTLKHGFNKVFNAKDWTTKFIIIFICIAFASAFRGINKNAGFWGAVNFLKFAWIYLLMKSYVNVDVQRKYMINGMLCAAWFQGIIGILQKINGETIGLSFLGETSTAFRVRELGNTISIGIAGTFAHSSDFSIFMLFALVIFMFNIDFIKKRILYASIIMIIITIYWAESRTILGLAFGSVMIFYLHGFRQKVSKRRFLLTVSGPLIVCLMWKNIGRRLLELFTGSDWNNQIVNRLSHWEVGWNEIIKSPIWGHGINNYSDWMKVLYPELYPYHFYYTNPIHNSYLQIWYDMGIVGLFFYIVIFISSIAYYLKNRKKSVIQTSGYLFICIALVYFWTGWAMIKEPITNMLWISVGLLHNKSDHSNIKHME